MFSGLWFVPNSDLVHDPRLEPSAKYPPQLSLISALGYRNRVFAFGIHVR